MPIEHQIDTFLLRFEAITIEVINDLKIESSIKAYRQISELRDLGTDFENLMVDPDVSPILNQFQFLYFNGYIIYSLIDKLNLLLISE